LIQFAIGGFCLLSDCIK